MSEITRLKLQHNKAGLIAYWTKENQLQKKKGYFSNACLSLFDRKLQNLRGKNVLDVGCGLGQTMKYFIDRGAKPAGLDINFDILKKAHGQGLNVSQADAGKIPFKDNSFDLVYSLGVVEHLPDIKSTLLEHVRVCKPEGKVIIIIPNLIMPYFLTAILFECLRGAIKYGTVFTIGKRISRRRLREDLQTGGCRDVKISLFYGSGIFRLFPFKLNKRIAERVERSFFSRKFGFMLYVEANK